jgi:hypothetical protein
MRHTYRISSNDGTTQIYSAINEICSKRELIPIDRKDTFHIQLTTAEAKKLRRKGCRIQRVKQKNSPKVHSETFRYKVPSTPLFEKRRRA